MAHNKITKAVFGNWQFCHRDTYELLSALKEKNLSFIPKDKSEFQSLGYQFGCIISTQQAYTKMLVDRKYSSQYYLSKKEKSLISIKEAFSQLKSADLAFRERVKKIEDNDVFRWRDVTTAAWRVISWLTEHERLHHGQLICYFRLESIPFPKNFQRVWNL